METKNKETVVVVEETQDKGNFEQDGVKLTPWEAKGKFTDEKYLKITEQFGASNLDTLLLERFEKLTGFKPHRLMRRGIFSAHRDFDKILDDFEAGKPIFLYTGRGPTTECLHIAHTLSMEFTVFLQRAFKAICIFQIADDEKYYFKDLEFDHVYRLGFKNAKDIIALGFDPERTFIFSNRDFSRDPHYQKVAFDMMKHVHINQVKAIFGIEDNCNVGQLMWPLYQSTAAFSQSFKTIFGDHKEGIRCLVAYAIDQDPYFRLCRDFSPKVGFLKPASLMCKFLPALEGDSKMSSTGVNGPVSTIFMDDNLDAVSEKIKKFAFSGGQETTKLHRELGGRTDVDISYQWLRYFMEDDQELERIKRAYESGKMLTSELKSITIKIVTDIIKEHQEKKSKVTDDIVKKFYEIRPMKL